MDEDGIYNNPHHHYVNSNNGTTFKLEDIAPSSWDYETGLPVVGGEVGGGPALAGWQQYEDEEEDDEDEDDEDEDEEDDDDDDEEEEETGEHQPSSSTLLPPPPPSSSTNIPKNTIKNKVAPKKNNNATAATTSNNTPKKKIRRIRPLRSCLACNKRKIKCDRDSTQGCGPCKKRGEGDSCSLVAGLTNSHLTNVAISERLAQLEARVDDLESIQQTSHYQYQQHHHSNNGLTFSPHSAHSLNSAIPLEDSVKKPSSFKGKGKSSDYDKQQQQQQQQQQQLSFSNGASAAAAASTSATSSASSPSNKLVPLDGRRRSSRSTTNNVFQQQHQQHGRSNSRNNKLSSEIDPALIGTSSSVTGTTTSTANSGEADERGGGEGHSINKQDKTISGESGQSTSGIAATATACETEEAALALESLCNTGDVVRTDPIPGAGGSTINSSSAPGTGAIGNSITNKSPTTFPVSAASSSFSPSSVSTSAATGFKRLKLDGSNTPTTSTNSIGDLQHYNSSQPSTVATTPSLSQSQAMDTQHSGLGISNFPTQAKNILTSSFPSPFQQPVSSSSSSTTNNNSSSNLMSAEERLYRSSIIVDPSTELKHGHRGQRSLETRLRILTSSTFPNKLYSDHLINCYFKNLAPLWHIHIDWLFEDEYVEFWKLRDQGRFLEIDPAWTALFFITLALGLQVAEHPLPPHLNPLPSGTPHEIISLSDSYLSDVDELLVAAHWARAPQLRVLQTLCLYSGFQSMTSLRDPTTFTMNGAGIRIAQMLGLHSLGPVDSPNVDLDKLQDDLALPTGSDALKSHLARIIWHTAVVMELVHVTRVGLQVPLASTPYTTALPNNVEDDDFKTILANIHGSNTTAAAAAAAGSSSSLSPTSAAAQSQLQIKMLAPRERPAWVLTGVSSLRCRALLSKIDMELLELPAEMKATEKYIHVMRIDSELRKWISAAPTRKASQNDYAAYKLSHWQHWSLMADVHGAIVHAHRPYMTRGYVDERFSFSTKTCLESAKVLCESWQHLRDYVTDQRFWWSSMRYLSAAIVIFIDLFQAMDNECTEDVLTSKRADIPLILNILQERMRSMHTTTATFAAAAFGVVHNLLEAEKAKKAAMAARRNSTDGSVVEDSEPVGRVFKRIAQNMSSASATKIETSSNSSIATAQSSPKEPLATTSSTSGVTGNKTPASASPLTEKPTFSHPADTNKKGSAKQQHKQVRQVAGKGNATGRGRNAPKLGRLPPLLHPTASTSASGGMSLSPGSGNLPPASHPELSPSAATVGTPTFAFDGNSNNSNNKDPQHAGAIAQAYTSIINPYVFQVQSSGTPVHDLGPNAMEPIQLTSIQGSNFPTYYPESIYPFSGQMSDMQMSTPTGTAMGGHAAFYTEPQTAPPITWDTSSLFHPDTSVLLHSMGFPAAQYDGGYAQQGRHATPLVDVHDQYMPGHTQMSSLPSASHVQQHMQQPSHSAQYQHHPSQSMDQLSHVQHQSQSGQPQQPQHMHHQSSDMHSWYADHPQY